MRSQLATLLALVAFSSLVAGPAHADAPGTALSADHFGVLVGSATAPVQLELFCDAQCPICAAFETASGGDLVRHLSAGDVAVTYRWLTFLDPRRHNDVSARLGNALMTAVGPGTSAAAYQTFVDNLYAHPGDPSLADIAATARESGLPAEVADRIAAGQTAVDTTSMNAFNGEQLLRVNPENPGTPTVYDLSTATLVATGDPGWLDHLVRQARPAVSG